MRNKATANCRRYALSKQTEKKLIWTTTWMRPAARRGRPPKRYVSWRCLRGGRDRRLKEQLPAERDSRWITPVHVPYSITFLGFSMRFKGGLSRSVRSLTTAMRSTAQIARTTSEKYLNVRKDIDYKTTSWTLRAKAVTQTKSPVLNQTTEK